MSTHWPIADLTVRCADLVLQLPNERDTVELAHLANAGIVAPGDPVSRISRWVTEPGPALPRRYVRSIAKSQSSIAPERWLLRFAIKRDGCIIGEQSVWSQEFLQLRSARTGSWLGREFQGQGYGTLARTAVLRLLFDHLHAASASSGWILGNHQSARISRRLGYRTDGAQPKAQDNARSWEVGGRVYREDWLERRAGFEPAQVDGLEPCLPMLIGDGVIEPDVQFPAHPEHVELL